MPIPPRLYVIPKMAPITPQISEQDACPVCGGVERCHDDEYADRQDETYDHPGDRFDG